MKDKEKLKTLFFQKCDYLMKSFLENDDRPYSAVWLTFYADK